MPPDDTPPEQPAVDEMLPDEREVLAERVRAIRDADMDDLHTLEEAAAKLDIDVVQNKENLSSIDFETN